MEVITKYFPDLSPVQTSRFKDMRRLYCEWNEKVNLVSRRDIGEIYTRHILHSLAIAKVAAFSPGTRIMDVGTGGGFPGIPLAVLFPGSEFTLVDSIGKKIAAAGDIASRLGLDNVKTVHGRAEDVPEKFDFVVCRAVAATADLIRWTWDKIVPGERNASPGGLLCLKGGDLESELALAGKSYTLYDINEFFDEDFFLTKKVVHFVK